MYQAGWGKSEIAAKPAGHAMHGYGTWSNRARGQHMPLYARALYIRDAQGGTLIFCLLDVGSVFHAMRAGIIEQLHARMGSAFAEAGLVLTCTHTHSGPGGCTQDVFYNLVTPGFVPANLQAVVDAGVSAIIDAWQNAAPTDLALATGEFSAQVDVAWNRSLAAYNRNPDVTPRKDTETHLAINRGMQVLSLRRDGILHSLLSLFGVHATCIGNTSQEYSGDNKGCAALATEQRLRAAGAANPVTLFAQSTAGDVSPHFQGPGDIARRRQLKGAAEFSYAESNGRLQTAQALAIANANREEKISGDIDVILTYVDFTDLKADPRFAAGNSNAQTSQPCLGTAFFAGTRVDGPGMPPAIALLAAKSARGIKALRLRKLDTYSPEDRAYYQRVYAAQGPKDILLEAGRKQILGQRMDKLPLPGFVDPLVGELKRQAASGAINRSALVPTVLPLQIVIIGSLALVCCPGEFTTIAGQRVMDTVAQALQPRGISRVLICTYCNDYMGYVTTCEEYQQQAYEGGHTIFGQWTLAAFQTTFNALAHEMLKPSAERTHDTRTRPTPPPADELALRTNLPVPRHA